MFYLTGAVGLDDHQLLIIFLTEDSRNLARILDLSSGRWRDVTPPPWAAGDQYELFACLATSINGIEESYTVLYYKLSLCKSTSTIHK